MADKQVLIIAEAGVNHNGSMENACRLIDVAAEAGVDFVKFQTFRADKLVAGTARKADYQVRNTGNEESQLQMLRKLELSLEDHIYLIDYAEKKGVAFLSTPFDLESIGLLASLGISTGKVPSGEITNLPYLRKMAQTFERIIISTGMSDLDEIRQALEVLWHNGQHRDTVTVLHCNTEYPTPMEDVNLRAMLQIGETFGVRTGYSDHTLGTEVPVAAVALGALVIEKHFTLDRNMEGPDHKASLEPHELKAMVSAIRNIEKALGDGIKRMSASEAANKAVARKSIVAAGPIARGELFSEENLTVKRPGDGISPMKWDEVIGRPASRDFEPDEKIEV